MDYKSTNKRSERNKTLGLIRGLPIFSLNQRIRRIVKLNIRDYCLNICHIFSPGRENGRLIPEHTHDRRAKRRFSAMVERILLCRPFRKRAESRALDESQSFDHQLSTALPRGRIAGYSFRQGQAIIANHRRRTRVASLDNLRV